MAVGGAVVCVCDLNTYVNIKAAFIYCVSFEVRSMLHLMFRLVVA